MHSKLYLFTGTELPFCDVCYVARVCSVFNKSVPLYLKAPLIMRRVIVLLA